MLQIKMKQNKINYISFFAHKLTTGLLNIPSALKERVFYANMKGKLSSSKENKKEVIKHSILTSSYVCLFNYSYIPTFFSYGTQDGLQ